MTYMDINRAFERLYAEAKDLPCATVYQFEIEISVPGDTIALYLGGRDEINAVDSSGRWIWHHDTIADYLAEREGQ